MADTEAIGIVLQPTLEADNCLHCPHNKVQALRKAVLRGRSFQSAFNERNYMCSPKTEMQK